MRLFGVRDAHQIHGACPRVNVDVEAAPASIHPEKPLPLRIPHGIRFIPQDRPQHGCVIQVPLPERDDSVIFCFGQRVLNVLDHLRAFQFIVFCFSLLKYKTRPEGQKFRQTLLRGAGG